MYVSRLSSAPTSGRRTLGSVVNQLVSAAELLNELSSRRRVDRKVLESLVSVVLNVLNNNLFYVT